MNHLYELLAKLTIWIASRRYSDIRRPTSLTTRRTNENSGISGNRLHSVDNINCMILAFKLLFF